jgi:hypothetical protein
MYLNPRYFVCAGRGFAPEGGRAACAKNCSFRDGNSAEASGKFSVLGCLFSEES